MPGIALTHGSPIHEDHYLLYLEDAAAILHQTTASVTFFGHTHLQGAFDLTGKKATEIAPIDPGSSEPESWSLTLAPDSRYLINPGSVGQPRDRDWRAAFALFDTEARTITFHRIPYDLETAQQRILSAGLPPRLAHRLAEGT
jgi:diadenosine tetraphosphatase ApaH/serine/threonine PP2A family protein phosphatase